MGEFCLKLNLSKLPLKLEEIIMVTCTWGFPHPSPKSRLLRKVKISRMYHSLFSLLTPKFFSFLCYTVLDHVIKFKEKKSMLLGYYLPYKNMLRSFHCLTLPGGSEENPHTNTCKKNLSRQPPQSLRKG